MKMKKVCITGGIACGKSSVGEMLRELGVRIIDADEVCHGLLRKDGPIIGRIVSAFGTGVLSRNGEIDRRILGRVVFADNAKRKKLNALVHPAARRIINAWLKMQSARANVAAAIVPLAYEAGWERGWDAVICVAAPLSAQILRLKRKGFSEKDAKARIAAQMPLAEKTTRADYIIFNAGTIAGLQQQARLVFRNINRDISPTVSRS